MPFSPLTPAQLGKQDPILKALQMAQTVQGMGKESLLQKLLENQVANAPQDTELQRRLKASEADYNTARANQIKMLLEHPELGDNKVKYTPIEGEGGMFRFNKVTGQIEPLTVGGQQPDGAQPGSMQQGETQPQQIQARQRETGFTREMGKTNADRVSGIMNEADQAQVNLARLQTMSELQNITETTPAAGFKIAAQKIGTYFGADPNSPMFSNVNNLREYRKLANDMVRDNAKNIKGNLTNRELEFLLQGIPSEASPSEVNRFIIGYMSSLENRKLEKGKFYRGVNEKGSNVKEIDSKWDNYVKSNPLAMKKGSSIVFREQFINHLVKDLGKSEQEAAIAWQQVAK